MDEGCDVMSLNKIYIRTSKEEQNPRLQLKDCETINKYGDYELIEEQQSAWSNKEREGFESIRKLIKQRKIEHLICWDLDRLYRNRKKLIAFFKLCKLYNCKIHSFRQPWLEELNNMPEPFGEIVYDMMLQIMGWMGEDESKKKSDRIKNAVRKNPGKITKSYKGNKWGRKSISTQKKNKIFEAMGRNPKPSFRTIASEFDVSVGTVHKLTIEFKQREHANLDVQQLSNL